MTTYKFQIEDKFYLGKKAARPEAMKLKLGNYLDYSAITLPKTFGHVTGDIVWHTLGNTVAGDCVVAGSCHEHMLWTGASQPPMNQFTEQGTLDIYKRFSGWNGIPDDPSDAGCDMVEFANYRMRTGLPDTTGKVHKIRGYAQIRSLDHALKAAYVFGAIGLGVRLPQSAETQFARAQPWARVSGSPIVGGHYIPIVGRNSKGFLMVVTWGRLQAVTPDFFNAYADEVIAYISDDYLNSAGKTPELLDVAALTDDLRGLANA